MCKPSARKVFSGRLLRERVGRTCDAVNVGHVSNTHACHGWRRGWGCSSVMRPVCCVVVGTVDGDWAGCRTTRCSASGGILDIGEYLWRHWSVTQATISLSAAEAEAKALSRGCAEGISAETFLEEITRENAQSGALHRYLERESNLTAIGTRKTSGTSRSRDKVGAAHIKTKGPESKQHSRR